MIKFFALAALTLLGTLILFASVIFFDPPAFFAYGFGILNGAGIVGLWAISLIRKGEQND